MGDLHGRGMKLVLDGVFNHMGRNAPIFQQAVADAASFVVVDAAGNRHDLTPGGVPVVLPRQTVSITAV
jgi:glycosidase